MKTHCTDVRRTRNGVGSYVKSIAPTVGLSLAATAAMALPEYGDVWRPPSGCNKYYTSGNGHHFCVIHDMEGYYYTAISYLDRCDVSASIYFGVNGLTDSSDQGAPPGQITQCVTEAHYAWHAGCWNTWMFGTEHEGFASSPTWYTEAMYQASAGLHQHLCNTYGIPKDRNHIIAHGQKLVSGWCTWLGANYPSINCTCNSHTDPGPYWNWSHFMDLIIGQVNNATVGSSSVPSSVVAGQAFTATITMNNTGTKPWTSSGSTPHRLGSQSPQDNTTWGLSRVALPSSPINAGVSATFTIHATAPATPGTYTFAWKMVQESVEWFGATLSKSITVVAAGPTITTQPASKTVNPGVNVTFTVAATGSGTLTYQWRKNGSNVSNGTKYAGVTTTSLTITSVQQTDVGNYSVAVTDANGTVTSSSAALTVNAVVAFTEDFEDGLTGWTVFPSPATVLASSTAQHESGTHSAYVNTSTDRMYRDLGIKVDGHLKITAYVYDSTQTRSFVDMRGYSGGSFNSGGLVQLFCAGKYNTVTMSGETWSSTNYQGRVLAGANAGWFNLNAAGAPARSTGWHKFVIERRTDGTTLDFYVDDKLSRTITGATPYSLDSAAIGSVGTTNSSAPSSTAGDAWIDDVKVEYFDLPVIKTPPGSKTVAAGAAASFSVVASNTVGSYQWRKNGNNISGATTSALTLNNVQGSDAGTYDVVVANGAGPVDSADATLRVSPTITTQPANSTNLPLSTATFTVVAAGQTLLSYQWRHNGTNLTDGGNLLGTLSDTLTVDNVTPQDAGSYSVIVTNLAGSATSANALLVPVLLPTITTSPENQTVLPGANVTFTTSATGTPPLSYQWNLNGADISGATGTSYTRLNVQPADAGTYSVVVTNAAGAVASDGAVLIVKVPPAITAQPQNQNVNQTSNALFSVVATGTPDPAYQWRFNAAPISGATDSSYTLGSVQPADAGSYSVVVSNIAGIVTSADAVLTVNVSPAITAQPQSVAAAAGSNVTFTVTATGTPPLAYQWNLNGTGISAATGSSYTRLNVQSGDAGTYSVTVSNVAGGLSSDGAVLTVNTAPTLSPIADQTVMAGQTLSFTAQASDIDAGQALTFSLDAGAPGAATIDSATGAFSWPTTAADAGTTNQITVRVTDSGTPSLTDSKTFAAIVLSSPITVSLSISNQDLTINWNSVSGQAYCVEYKDDWSAPTWSNLPPESIAATGAATSLTDTLTNAQRFYRVRLLP